MGRLITLRRSDLCVSCESHLAVGDKAYWEASTRSTTCVSCTERRSGADEPDHGSTFVVGEAGRSARREAARHVERRERDIRARHRKLGRLILALSDAPQSTRAWSTGAHGEEIVGGFLNARASADFVVLHDRAIPGSQANIDHIVVTRAGVVVVDTKRYAGSVVSRDVGHLFRRDMRLYVGRRDCTKLIEGVRAQRDSVTQLLAEAGVATRVRPVLAFSGAEWPFFARPLVFGDVVVTWAKGLVPHIEKLKFEAPTEVPAAVAALAALRAR